MGAKQADLHSGKAVAPARHSGEQLQAFPWGAAQGSRQLHPESARVFKASCSQNKESHGLQFACLMPACSVFVRFSVSRLSRLPLETNGFNCMQQSGLRAEFWP